MMGLLDEYVAAMASLKGKTDVMDEATINTWGDLHSMAQRIIEDRRHNMPSLSYDPGYYIPGDWNDSNYWTPQWETRAGTVVERIGYGSFYLYYNTFDETGRGNPREKPAIALFNGKYPVGGYKCGFHHFTKETFSSNNGASGSTHDLSTVSVDMVNVTYYCLLPETTGCSNSIWCVDPNDWFAK